MQSVEVYSQGWLKFLSNKCEWFQESIDLGFSTLASRPWLDSTREDNYEALEMDMDMIDMEGEAGN